MPTPRKYMPDGSRVPIGRPKGMDTMAAYALVPTEKIVHKPGPKPKLKPRAKQPWSQSRGVQQVQRRGGRKVSGESIAMREAFERYLAMGDDRSISALAEAINRPEITLHTWSKKYNWVNRVLTYEKENSDSLMIEPHEEQMEKRKFGLKLLDKILKNTVTMNEDGTIATCSVEAKSPSDVRTLLILRDELLNPERGGKTFGKGSQINAENAVFIIKK